MRKLLLPLMLMLLVAITLFAGAAADRGIDNVYNTITVVKGSVSDTMVATLADNSADSVVMFSKFVPDGDAGYLYSLIMPKICKAGTTIADSVYVYLYVKCYDDAGTFLCAASTGDTISTALPVGGRYLLPLGSALFPGKQFDIVVKGINTKNQHILLFKPAYLAKLRSYTRVK
jgi:hypothetical protein